MFIMLIYLWPVMHVYNVNLFIYSDRVFVSGSISYTKIGKDHEINLTSIKAGMVYIYEICVDFILVSL